MAYTGSKSQSSQGVVINVNATNASPPVWVKIGECLGVKFSDKAMFDDSTNLDSTAKEFLSVLPDPGKVQGKLNRVSTDAGQAVLKTSYNAGTRLLYQVVFPINLVAGQTVQGDIRQFLAYVESIAPDIGVNKKIDSDFSLQITGAITEIQGS